MKTCFNIKINLGCLLPFIRAVGAADMEKKGKIYTALFMKLEGSNNMREDYNV
jgi:hypothetical protein